MGHRRRLQRHAEMLELPAGIVAGLVQFARAGSSPEAPEQSAKLVSGCKSAGELLGAGAGLSSHCPDLDELRAARSVAPGAGGRAGKPLASASGKSSRAQGGLARAW